MTFVLTYSVYLPATFLGYPALPWLQPLLAGASPRFDIAVQPLAVFEPVTGAVVDVAGVGLGLVAAVLVLFVSLTLFDRVLARVDTEWLRRRFFRRFQRKWTALGLGVLVTGATTSVAFSLGVVVPLYNRGYVKRREIIPYVLGANIGTLFDTVVIAVLLNSPDVVSVVLSLLAVGTLVTLVALLAAATYFGGIQTVQDRLVEDRRALAAFLLSLVVLPVGFALFPF